MTGNKIENLFFVPHYVASLRYFERLKPYLDRKYSVNFLLINTSGEKYLQPMIEYCKEKGLEYKVIGNGLNDLNKNSLNYFSFFKQAKQLKNEIEDFLSKNSITKLIGFNDRGFPLHYFFKQASHKGIDTMVLQWTFLSRGQQFAPRKISKSSLRRVAFNILSPLNFWLRKKVLEFGIGEKLDMSKGHGGLGSGSSKRIGVMNQRTAEFMKESGIPADKIQVVGYLDFSTSEDIKKELDGNSDKKIATAKRLGIDLKKKNIMILTSAYNSDVVRMLDDAGQLDFYSEIVNMIRKVCPDDLFGISLKIHPRENLELYRPLEKKGIKLFDRFTNNFELIYFADLYIADSTTTNFIPMIMQKNVIFINFLNMDLIEKTREDLCIKKFIHDKNEFSQLLSDFKNNRLEKQYSLEDDVYVSDSARKIVEWIG